MPAYLILFPTSGRRDKLADDEAPPREKSPELTQPPAPVDISAAGLRIEVSLSNARLFVNCALQVI